MQSSSSKIINQDYSIKNFNNNTLSLTSSSKEEVPFAQTSEITKTSTLTKESIISNVVENLSSPLNTSNSTESLNSTMLPNNIGFSPFNFNTSTPIKSHLLNLNVPLLTPDKCNFNNSPNNLNTLMLLAAASSSALSSYKNSTVTSVSSSAAKKRKIEESHLTLNSNGSSVTGNRLDRAVRKLTDRLEAKLDHVSDNFAAVSPSSSASTSSSLSDSNKESIQDSSTYISSNGGTTSTEASAETTPIKRTFTPDNSFASELNNYNNIMCSNASFSSPNNIVSNQLTKFFQNIPSFQNLVTTNSVVTPTLTASKNSTSPVVIDPFGYVYFLKNLAAAATALSISNNNTPSLFQTTTPKPKIETKSDNSYSM